MKRVALLNQAFCVWDKFLMFHRDKLIFYSGPPLLAKEHCSNFFFSNQLGIS